VADVPDPFDEWPPPGLEEALAGMDEERERSRRVASAVGPDPGARDARHPKASPRVAAARAPPRHRGTRHRPGGGTGSSSPSTGGPRSPSPRSATPRWPGGSSTPYSACRGTCRPAPQSREHSDFRARLERPVARPLIHAGEGVSGYTRLAVHRGLEYKAQSPAACPTGTGSAES
jgi:hypothetical protein